MKRAHGLFNRGVGIETMDPEDVNVVGFQAFEGLVHVGEDGGSRET